MKRHVGLSTCLLFALAGGWLAAADSLSAAQSPSPSPASAQDAGPREKPAEQVYRNIQVFQGLPASQLYPAMNYIAGALGVSCAHCHVPGQFEKDDKPAKQTARRMIQMTQAINRANFGGQLTVTCYTCHRGQAAPAAVPALTPPALPHPNASGATPTVAELLDNYVTALGGRERLEKITTLTMRGTEAAAGSIGPPATRGLEIYRKAPDKLLRRYEQGGQRSSQAFDGKAGWQQFNGRTIGLSATDLGMLRRETPLDRHFNLRAQYAAMAVVGKARLGEREAWVIEATPVEGRIGPMPFAQEKLFFDARTGLLIRRYLELQTAMGRVPFATDFEDYREAEGLKWPLTIRYLFPTFNVTQQFTEIRLNVPIEDERFSPPAPKR